VVLIDQDSGTFAFSFRAEDTSRNLPELVMQIWAPFDYLTVEWDAFVMPEVLDGLAAVLFVWAIDNDGHERQISLGTATKAVDRSAAGESDTAADLFVGDFDSGGAGLTGVSELPPIVPDAIRRGVAERQATRVATWEEAADCLAHAQDKNVWIRQFGGATVGGKVKEVGKEIVSLHRPRYLSPLGRSGAPGVVRLARVAAARVDPRRRIPKHVASQEFGKWMRQTDFARTPPQLWGTLCEECINAVRPPWRTGPCYRCREGKPIELPADDLADLFAG
jgi:hypothetical protein